MKGLNTFYKTYAMCDIAHKMGYNNISYTPSLETIILTIFLNDKKLSDSSFYWTIIYIYLWIQTGQKPIKIRAKKSLANFQIFEGDILGLCVCLRKYQAFKFLDSLVKEGIPYLSDKNPDFQGFSNKSFTKSYTLGFNSIPLLSYLSPISGLSKLYTFVHPGLALNLNFSNGSKYQNLWVTALHFPTY